MNRSVVEAFIKKGEIEEAWEATGSITDLVHRAEVAFDIARHTGNTQDFEEALSLASHIKDEDKRSELVAIIKGAQAH